MPFRNPFRRQPPTESIQAAAPPRPSTVTRVLGPLKAVGSGGYSALTSLDRMLCWIAVPFGVTIRDPRLRFAVLLGMFALIFAIGSLPISFWPLVALVCGYIGVLAIGRAWVVNEKERTAIVKKLKDGDPDQMPDLRVTALVSALQLFILFPLLFQQVQAHYQLYEVTGEVSFWDWFWFAIDKTYLKALPDWTVLYDIHISTIKYDASWGRHLILFTRLTFDFILIQGLLRLWAIRTTIAEAVAAVKADPDMAVRLGKRAILPLTEKLNDTDKTVRGAAANALTQLGDKRALLKLSE
jgi:hypothetical protein